MFKKIFNSFIFTKFSEFVYGEMSLKRYKIKSLHNKDYKYSSLYVKMKTNDGY